MNPHASPKSDPSVPPPPKSSSLGSPYASSPARLGYRMPAEWEPHQATWMSWPHNRDTWLCGLDDVYRPYAELVRAIAADEEVHINVNDGPMERLARDVLGSLSVAGDIRFHHIPTDDAWCRDHGAIVVVNRESESAYPTRVAVDWGYNAWGEKYPPFENDNAVANHMARALQFPSVSGGMILEGGSIEVNGAGLLMTTESCLLNSNRNPALSRDQIEERLASMLGMTHAIWLQGSIAGDDTDGHIDGLARFVDTHTVVTVVEEDPEEENFQALQANLQALRAVSLPDGKRLAVETLPMPRPIVNGSQRLPASYANFYITNHSVLVPQFGQPADQVAADKLGSLLPGRRVVGIDCRTLISGLGAIHCLTQQIPTC